MIVRTMASERTAPPAGRDQAPVSSKTFARPATLDADPPLLSMRLVHQWELLDSLRSFLTAFCRGRFQTGTVERMVMASAELVENALKYGSVATDIGYELRESEGGIEIRVSNDAVESRIAVLERRVRETMAVPADQAFHSALKGVSRGVPMLGLARIRSEARFDLDTTVNTRRVTVLARGRR